MHEHRVVKDNSSEITRVLVITLVMNELVAVMKLFWGYMSGSVGMISDGFHSMFDGVTNIIGIIGIRLSSAPPDKCHPYGHRKYETMMTVLVSGLIFITCFEVARNAWEALSSGARALVTATSFVIMLITMAINLAVMTYEHMRGRELGSEFLVADALHTKSNLLASCGVLAGLIFTRMGLLWADAFSGIVVAFFIGRIGFEILGSASGILVDRAPMDIAEVEAFVLGIDGVRGCHDLRARGAENHIHLDLHIQLDAQMTLDEAHSMTHLVQSRIRERFPTVVDIVVHTEPFR